MTDDATLHSAELVRERDPDRYLSDLFAPAAARPHLFALHAFALEIADIRRKVSQPTLGEIRLKWWETAIRGEHGGHPLAAAVAEAITRFNLPLPAFDNMLRARVFDLYDDPMPTLNDLEGYAGDTESAVMQLGAMILAGGRDPGTAEVSGLAGVAVCLTRLLRALPRHAAEGQTFLPEDVLARHGVSGRVVPPGGPELRAALGELRALARGRLEDARQAARTVDPSVFPAFLNAATLGLYLDQMEGPGFDPFRGARDPPPFRRQWVLWRAARTGRL